MVRTALAVILVASALASCGPDGMPILPDTELPKLPTTATIKCENLTDAEVIALLQRPETRAAGAKNEINCAYLENLQKFVTQTWDERDKK